MKLYKDSHLYSNHSDIHSYQTRNRSNLIVPDSRINMSKINKLDVRLFNHLPLDIRNLNLRSFKIQLRKIMVENCYYSVSDYLKTKIVVVS